MSITRLFIPFAVACLLASCSKEASVQPSNDAGNIFEAPANATDPTSTLRRNFYQKHGIYVIFTDTLRSTFLGNDPSGKPCYKLEMLNLAYDLMTPTKNKYSFNYLNTLELQQNFISFIEKWILPHMGKEMKPYSIMGAADVYRHSYYTEDDGEGFYGSPVDILCGIGARCDAVSFNKIAELTEHEAMVSYFSMKLNSKALAHKLYKTFSNTIDPESIFATPEQVYVFTTEPTSETFLNAGIMGVAMVEKVEDVEEWHVYLYDKETEFNNFLKEYLMLSADEFTQKYGDYRWIMAKYEVMKQIVTQLGYIN